MKKEIEVRRAQLPVACNPEQDRFELAQQRRPWVAMSLITVAAAAERLLVHATGEERALLIITMIVAFAAAVVLGHISSTRVMGKQLRRRFMLAVWGGAGWLVYVAACGLSWGAFATMAVVGSALSMLFWAEHRIYGPPRIDINMAPVDEADPYAARWKANLGGKTKCLAGSKLTEREQIPSGWRYTLQLVPGNHTMEMVMGLTGKIRSGLQLLPGQEVVIEPHPELAEPNVLLTLVTKSTVKVDQQWPGPDGTWDSRTGSVIMGPYIDGEGSALFSVYRKDGMFGGFLQGGIGSGKSRGLETIAMACASSTSHPTTVWFACGQDGASSPLLMAQADATATTPEEVLNMLDAGIAVMRVNGLENRQRGLRGFRPTRERPGLLIIIDEFHNFLDQDELGIMAVRIQSRMARLAREARKAGVALILATQDPLLTAFGPGKRADVLRARLLEGNGLVLRSESISAKQVFKVEVQPRLFPDLPGYTYLARPAPGERQAPFRFFYVNDDAIETWADSFVWRTLSPTQQNAVLQLAGDWYATRRDRAATRNTEDENLLEMFRAGGSVDLSRLTREDFGADDDLGFGSPFPVNIPTFAEVLAEFEESAAKHEPTAKERRPLTGAESAVLGAVRQGVSDTKGIIEVTGYSSSAVHQALSGLESRGLLRRPRTGRYEVAA